MRESLGKCGSIQATGHQLELLQPALAEPYLLDDATVSRLIRVDRDQVEDLQLFTNQADRWQAQVTTDAERAELTTYRQLIEQLRRLNEAVLEAGAHLADDTIEKMLAKSDAELGLETLFRPGQGQGD